MDERPPVPRKPSVSHRISNTSNLDNVSLDDEAPPPPPPNGRLHRQNNVSRYTSQLTVIQIRRAPKKDHRSLRRYRYTASQIPFLLCHGPRNPSRPLKALPRHLPPSRLHRLLHLNPHPQLESSPAPSPGSRETLQAKRRSPSLLHPRRRHDETRLARLPHS